jgi:aarF domain-containing kinase
MLIRQPTDITLSDKFKSEYCRLWRSLFTLDTKSIEDIALKWGIQLPVDLFASAILLRPFQVDKRRRAAENLPEEPPKSEYEQQVELKQRMRNMLANEALIPRVCLFLFDSLNVTHLYITTGIDLYNQESENVPGEQPSKT